MSRLELQDTHNFENIYNLYVDDLLAYGIGLGFNCDMIKDATQDIFCKLYLKRGELAGISNLKYYLFRMLKNRLLDLSKNTVITSEIDKYETSFAIKVTILDRIISEEDRAEVCNKVNTLLNTLTDRQREAVYLRFIQEMEYDEIAGLLNMTPQATRNLIARAMERMRNQNGELLAFFLLVIDVFSLKTL